MSLALAAAIRGRLDDPAAEAALPQGVPAAVIVPIIDGPEPSILFTLRTELVRDHKGEISFPGGVRHLDDPDLLTTALRETEEELGIPPSAMEVLGALPPTHTVVSGYVIQPFVAILDGRPPMTPSAAEIAEILELPVRALLEAEREVSLPGGRPGTMPVYDLEGRVVWGATGRILQALLSVLRSGRWM